MSDNDLQYGAHIDGKFRDPHFLNRAGVLPTDDHFTRITKVQQREAYENYRGPKPSLAHPRLFWCVMAVIIGIALMLVLSVLQH
ncbi:hypothetical protein LGM65_25860 [Burkholderia anthina]|uniref:hypothetical protein n=1 Tax=Burkholderia anthina TaxID=179879 RepID=UPI001CF49A05|nr:hypothetical protein [Burkholderia anthina]MCA8094264.1 hypothetical protein [Burkholderia anthina]